jgi:cyclopropane fatty-acyl-phospholipid synthase-like methyltransferase
MRGAAPSRPGAAGEREHLQGEELETYLETGRRDAGGLARAIERHTGETLEGRVLLDYGCGPGRVAVPLAERCAHVYGLELQTNLFTPARANAERAGVTNVEWRPSTDLASLAGSYDAFVSMWVFQHIPSREGERILAQLVGGLRAGGVGVFNFAVRPSRPLAGFREGPRRRADLAGYAYHLMHSSSFSRVGEILVAANVNEWHTRWAARDAGGLMDDWRRKRHPLAMLVLKKPE